MDSCPICDQGYPAFSELSPLGENRYFTCTLCGKFGARDIAVAKLSNLSPLQRQQLLQWLRDDKQQSSSDTPLITMDLLESEIARYRPLRVTERATLLLKHCVAMAPMGTVFANYGEAVQDLCRISYALGQDELESLVEYLTDHGYVFRFPNKTHFRITAQGVNYIEEGGAIALDSNQVFIAMWFKNELQQVLDEGIIPAIIKNGFDPLRIDQKEHNNKIDDEIVAEIRRSRFLVADFTGHRGGVYFEAGFAMGLALPVIWTCAVHDIEKLHFDIRQYNCIDWHSVDDLRVRLTNRIGAVVGQGRNRSSD